MKRYMFILIKHKISLIILFFIILLSSLLTIAMTYLGGKYIDVVVAENGMVKVYKVCIVLFFVTLINLITRFIINLKTNLTAETVIFDFKKTTIDYLRNISVIKYSEFNITYLSKKIDEDTRQIAEFIIKNYANFIVKTLEIIIILVICLKTNFLLGCTIVFLCPIYYLLYKKFRKEIFKRNLAAKEKETEFFRYFSEQLEFLEDILISADFDEEDNILNGKYLEFYKSYKRYINITSLLTFFNGLLICIMQIIIFVIGGFSITRGHVTVGVLSILIAYFVQILTNITYYIELGREYQTTKTSVHRMNQIYDIEEEKEGVYELDLITNVFANISYSIAENKIISKAKINVSCGEVVGIFGKNGAGKTTFMKLVIGLYKCRDNNCNIIYNQQYSINEINCKKLRKDMIAYVPQKIRFRDILVKEILNEESIDQLVGRLEEKNILLTEEIKNILIKKWNKGVNTLSGGDKQIVAILQSLLKDSDIIIFDEPTSNIDKEKIEWFCQMITLLKKEKIIFIITHDNRLSEIFDKKLYL